MRQLLRFAVLIGFACAPAASAFVLAEEKAQEGDVTVVAEAAVVKAVVPGNVDPQIEQFIQQFRPILRAEYHLIRKVCGLTKEQRKRIALEGERAVKDAAAKYNEMQHKIRRGMSVNPEPRGLIQESLVSAVKANVSAAQLARYQAEVEKRAEDRKRVVIHNLVAKLDQDLILSSEQRDKLTASLSSHWSDAWSQSLEMLLNGGDQVFPNIPDQHVAPLLDEKQRRVWAAIPKQQGGFWGGGFGFMGGMMEGDPFEDEDLKEARQAGQEQGGKK